METKTRGDGQVERFPQTHMGWSRFSFMDYFSRARAYEQNRKQTQLS
ncbi:MAG: hypothetical protein IPL35_05705 [Sphingobacteriales bacterium]|nr:hypothetical protein [Sphingobacteriales bacterium]